MLYNLIVAMCRNNGIGYKGQTPWHISQDLTYFSKITKGDGNNAVVMGNNTWQSLPIITGKPKGLLRRDNFVLSRTDKFDMLLNHDRLIKTFNSTNEIDAYLDQPHNIYEEVWVIGGAQIYKQFLEQGKIDKCYVTYIDAEFECDAFFPELDKTVWREVERMESYDTTYNCNVSYIVYERSSSGQSAIY